MRLASLRPIRRGLLRIGATLLLLSLLPSLLYIDHWSDAIASDGEAQHYAHCHYDTSTCSDQPALTGVQAFPDLIALPQPDLQSVLVEFTAVAPEGRLMAPPTEPPRV